MGIFAKTAKKKQEKRMDKQFMTDSQGREVPVSMVKDIDILRDQTVKAIMTKTFAMRDALVSFKQGIWSDIQEFLSLSSEQHGMTICNLTKSCKLPSS